MNEQEQEYQEIYEWWKNLSVPAHRYWIAEPESGAELEHALLAPALKPLEEILTDDVTETVNSVGIVLGNIFHDDPSCRVICKLGAVAGPDDEPILTLIGLKSLFKSDSARDFVAGMKTLVEKLGHEVNVHSVAECSLDWLRSHESEAQRTKLWQKWQDEFSSTRSTAT